MRRLSRLVWMTSLLAAAFLPRAPIACAQSEPEELASRGPRFLLASATPLAPPARVDVSRTPVLRQRLSLNLEGATLDRALTAIRRLSGLQLIYSSTVVPLDRTVHLKADDITVAGALTEVLLDTDVDVLFSKSGKAVLVRRSAPGTAVPDTGAIVGRITTKATGAPIVGAMVVLDGATQRAASGEDGKYRITDVPTGTYTVRARYIGYAPGMASVTVVANQEVTADFALERSAQRLDEVVTTGTIIPTEVKALPNPVTVITGDQIARKNIQHVDELFRGDVPGVLAWNQGGANGYFSQFATIRGSSTLSGYNTTKVYVDGVEMANENFLADIDPASIDRLEIIRGPQASTLYGSQALNGVVQIFTKKGTLGLTRPEVEAKVSTGVSETRFIDKTPVAQDYSLQVRGGGDQASYNLGGAYRSLGAYAPESYDRTRSIFGGARVATGPLALDVSLHYYDRPFGAAINPLLPVQVPQQHNYSYDQRQQTYSGTLTYRVKPWWTHSLTAGADRNSFEDYNRRPPLTTPADTFVSLLSGDNTRLSVAYSTSVELRLGNGMSSSWTAGLDYWSSRMSWIQLSQTPSVNSIALAIPTNSFFALAHFPGSNTGYFGQAQLGFRDAVFLTAGLRADESSDVGAAVGTVWAPRVGLSAVHQWGTLSGKLRASYGKGIRPPGPAAATGYVQPGFVQLANPELRPEQQFGFDMGVEFDFGTHGSLQATYYNQVAKDLLSLELRGFDTTTATFLAQYVNLSRVKNTGWEFAGTLALAPALTLNGTFAITTSKVVDPGTSSSFYLPGDRILGVPRSTGGATLTYAFPRTTLSAGLTYGGSWTNTDVLRQNDDYYVKQVFTNPFRSYWITYPSFTRLTASVTQRLTTSLSGFAQVNNLTNKQTGEIDNTNITPGRTTVVGLHLVY
jgi:iron complex outermembrane recepter protein